jgi:hypothetical protein
VCVIIIRCRENPLYRYRSWPRSICNLKCSRPCSSLKYILQKEGNWRDAAYFYKSSGTTGPPSYTLVHDPQNLSTDSNKSEWSFASNGIQCMPHFVKIKSRGLHFDIESIHMTPFFAQREKRVGLWDHYAADVCVKLQLNVWHNLTNFPKMWYVTDGNHKKVLLTFLQPITTLWRECELVGWVQY